MNGRDIGALLIACSFVACARMPTAPAVAPPSGPPQGFPEAAYAKAAARGADVFRIDPERSTVTIRVYRGGTLARFGHDHVMASRDVHGYVQLAEAAADRHADLYAPLASLSIDEPALRAQAGFDTQPSQGDIEGTRSNMLEKVLDAERFPFVSVHLDHVSGEAPTIRAEALITLHGMTHTVPVTVSFDRPSATAIYARGRFSVKQTDFGIAPYSFLGGALKVEDRVDIAFDLTGVRATPK